jgi:ABC-type lipoprotein export system ATPase subunit
VPGQTCPRFTEAHPQQRNLRIRPSEFVGIIGANGSGKSTLMNIFVSATFTALQLTIVCVLVYSCAG